MHISFSTKSFIRELAAKSHQIYHEKKRGEKLLTKLLPKMIATNLKENKVRIWCGADFFKDLLF